MATSCMAGLAKPQGIYLRFLVRLMLDAWFYSVGFSEFESRNLMSPFQQMVNHCAVFGCNKRGGRNKVSSHRLLALILNRGKQSKDSHTPSIIGQLLPWYYIKCTFTQKQTNKKVIFFVAF